MREQHWGLAAARGLGLDTTQYSLRGSNVHNVGEHGWYQGKGTVNATPINFKQFFAELPRAVSQTEVSHKNAMLKLDAALTTVRKLFLSCHKAGGRVVFIGNGGSASIASHMAVDYTKNGAVRAIAFNDVPTLTCLANDFGYDNVFSKQLEYYATKKDVIVIISSSGRSLNILAAAKAATAMGCAVVTFTGMNPNNALRALGSINFWIPSADYGIVELTHLSLLHAMVDIRLQSERAAQWKKR